MLGVRIFSLPWLATLSEHEIPQPANRVVGGVGSSGGIAVRSMGMELLHWGSHLGPASIRRIGRIAIDSVKVTLSRLPAPPGVVARIQWYSWPAYGSLEGSLKSKTVLGFTLMRAPGTSVVILPVWALILAISVVGLLLWLPVDRF